MDKGHKSFAGSAALAAVCGVRVLLVIITAIIR